MMETLLKLSLTLLSNNRESLRVLMQYRLPSLSGMKVCP